MADDGVSRACLGQPEPLDAGRIVPERRRAESTSVVSEPLTARSLSRLGGSTLFSGMQVE